MKKNVDVVNEGDGDYDDVGFSLSVALSFWTGICDDNLWVAKESLSSNTYSAFNYCHIDIVMCVTQTCLMSFS